MGEGSASRRLERGVGSGRRAWRATGGMEGGGAGGTLRGEGEWWRNGAVVGDGRGCLSRWMSSAGDWL